MGGATIGGTQIENCERPCTGQPRVLHRAVLYRAPGERRCRTSELRYTKEAGWTLIELLVTLSILALLIGLSMPGLETLIERKRGEITMQRLQRLVEFTRISAVSASALTTLCPTSDGLRCGGAWERGAMVFLDAEGDRKLDPGEQPLRVLLFDDVGGSITWRAFGARQYLQYTPLGFTRNQNGSFTYCADNGDLRLARQLIINRPGRTRVATDRDGDGIVEGSGGRVPSC